MNKEQECKLVFGANIIYNSLRGVNTDNYELRKCIVSLSNLLYRIKNPDDMSATEMKDIQRSIGVAKARIEQLTELFGQREIQSEYIQQLYSMNEECKSKNGRYI